MNARTLSPASNRLGVKHVIATPDPAAGFFTTAFSSRTRQTVHAIM